MSVAAHTLYEKTRPDLLPGPGGVLDLSGARYEQISEHAVRVRGSVCPEKRLPYQIKLEGAAVVGYRCIFIAGIRDPILIGQIDSFLDMVRKYLGARYPQLGTGEAKTVLPPLWQERRHGGDGAAERFRAHRDRRAGAR